VIVATNPEEKGTVLFNMGRYAEARAHLEDAARRGSSPVLRAMAFLARADGGMPPPEAGDELKQFAETNWSRAAVFEATGVSCDYLDELPFIEFERSDLLMQGVDPSARATPEMILEEGAYSARILLSTSGSRFVTNGLFRASVIDRRNETVLSSAVFKFAALTNGWGGEREATLRFEIPAGVPCCTLLTKVPIPEEVVVRAVEVRPEPAGTLARLQRRLAGGD